MLLQHVHYCNVIIFFIFQSLPSQILYFPISQSPIIQLPPISFSSSFPVSSFSLSPRPPSYHSASPIPYSVRFSTLFCPTRPLSPCPVSHFLIPASRSKAMKTERGILHKTKQLLLTMQFIHAWNLPNKIFPEKIIPEVFYQLDARQKSY